MPGDSSPRRGTKWAGSALLLAAVTFASRHRLREHLLPGPAARVTPEDESLVANGDPDPANGVSLDPAVNRVVRRGTNGESLWSTSLAGDLGRVRQPHLRADDARAHVTCADGVTALVS